MKFCQKDKASVGGWRYRASPGTTISVETMICFTAVTIESRLVIRIVDLAAMVSLAGSLKREAPPASAPTLLQPEIHVYTKVHSVEPRVGITKREN